MKTIPETANGNVLCLFGGKAPTTTAMWMRTRATLLQNTCSKVCRAALTTNATTKKQAGHARRRPRHFGQTPSQSLAASAGAAVAVAAATSAAAGAAFMPLNKNICHLLLAFWLNAKLNEVDLHISLPAFAFKYTWQLLPSLSLSLASVSLGMCRIRLSVEFSCSVYVCLCVCVFAAAAENNFLMR